MKIALVIGSLRLGGAERAAVTLCNHWVSDHEVALVTLDDGRFHDFEIMSSVERVDLRLPLPTTRREAILGIARRILRLRRFLRDYRPQVVVAFETSTSVLALMAAFGTRQVIVACEHIDPRQVHLARIWQVLRRRLYPRADALVVLSPRLREWGEGLVSSERIHVIPNPVVASRVRRRAVDVHSHDLRVVALGRLVHQKGFDLLVRALASLSDKYPEWNLSIYGEGDERDNLASLVEGLGMSGRVTLEGVGDPWDVFQAADLFVLSSRFEGFPIVLLEAMAAGVPVIAADCPTGPSEIISDGIDGVLVPPEDVTALTGALDLLMSDGDRREALGRRARVRARSFDVGQVASEWERLFKSLLNPGYR